MQTLNCRGMSVALASRSDHTNQRAAIFSVSGLPFSATT